MGWRQLLAYLKDHWPVKHFHVRDDNSWHIRDKYGYTRVVEVVHPVCGVDHDTGKLYPNQLYTIPKYGDQVDQISAGAAFTQVELNPPPGETWLVYQITVEHTDIANREGLGAMFYTTVPGVAGNLIELAGAGTVTVENDVETLVYPTLHDRGNAHDHFLGNEPLWMRHNFMFYVFTITGLLVDEIVSLTYIYRRVMVE